MFTILVLWSALLTYRKGSGWASHIAAKRLGKEGMSSIIIEFELFGGDCPFWACVPSKALLRPGEALDEAKKVPGVSSNVSNVTGPDVEKVLERRDAFTSNWDDSRVVIPFISGDNITLVRGRGKIIGVKQVLVESPDAHSVTLDARQAVVVCTGSEPIFPNIPGLAEAKPWTPRHAASTSLVPKHLVILGAGAVGCEMATVFTDLGGKVSLISSTTELLPRIDPEAGALVRQSLSAMGVKVYVSAKVTKVHRISDSELVVSLQSGVTINATEILVAAGRRPRTEDLGLEAFGLAVDGRPIAVDESLLVPLDSGNWLYAGGDVNGRAAMTHTTKYQGRILASSILARRNGAQPKGVEWDAISATADKYARPQVVFTRPTVASVGFTRHAAKASGKKVREITAPLKTLGARLREDEFEDGWAQWIIDEDSGTLLGATFVGDNVTELLHASTVAIVGHMDLARLAHAIPSFPTMSEVYLSLIEAAGF